MINSVSLLSLKGWLEHGQGWSLLFSKTPFRQLILPHFKRWLLEIALGIAVSSASKYRAYLCFPPNIFIVSTQSIDLDETSLVIFKCSQVLWAGISSPTGVWDLCSSWSLQGQWLHVVRAGLENCYMKSFHPPPRVSLNWRGGWLDCLLPPKVEALTYQWVFLKEVKR